MNQVPEVAFFPALIFSARHLSAHTDAGTDTASVGASSAEFGAKALWFSFSNDYTKTMTTPLKVTPIETENSASIYPNFNS